jgi:hypothetical protein
MMEEVRAFSQQVIDAQRVEGVIRRKRQQIELALGVLPGELESGR